MKPQQPTNDLTSHLLKSKVVEMPFSDFEDRMMQRIVQQAEVSKQAHKDIKMSTLCFTIGCCLGIVATAWGYAYQWRTSSSGDTPLFVPVVLVGILALLHYRWPELKRRLGQAK
ncbi:hypothetical protein [Mucilaginibacter myungsuensis]|uniref:Uncharacterized protein n=1 Tax=Mucilaginibacter myungsuensis TaxID=649104 RepID=A0A929L1W0_9SPHI|nr:hypothetical protein [Mucilaginibacter myungsuensis]MBE9664088.1 hypothetical protein [Mucilaginibacter myungsuensis]MDN3601267.1 hypothetical protein [Mucilaginibacter myungsuensis]